MDISSYEDSQVLDSSKQDGMSRKRRPTTLNLDSPNNASKRQKSCLLSSPDLNMLKLTTPELDKLIIENSNLDMTPTPDSPIIIPKSWTEKKKFSTLITSPDLNMLKLTTPEIEKFIIENSNLAVTPIPHSPIIIPKSWTEEKMNYSNGFTDATSRLHQDFSGNQDNRTGAIKSPRNSPSVLTNWNPSTVRPATRENTTSNLVPLLQSLALAHVQGTISKRSP